MLRGPRNALGDKERHHAKYLFDPKALTDRSEAHALYPRTLIRRRATDGSHHGHGSRLPDTRCRSGTGDYLILQETPQLDAYVQPYLYGRMLMPPRLPQRTGVVVQLTDELLELYSLDISQPSGTSDLCPPSRVHHGPWPRMHLGSVLLPSYRRVSAGGVYSQPLPSLVNQ